MHLKLFCLNNAFLFHKMNFILFFIIVVLLDILINIGLQFTLFLTQYKTREPLNVEGQ